MIKFLDLKKFIKGKHPVTTTEILTREGTFHENGLFSEKIFGPEGTPGRGKAESYIELHTKVIHPSALKILFQLDQKIKKFISVEETFSLDKHGALKEDPNGVTGIHEFIKLFPSIKFRGETETRDKYIKLMKYAYENDLLFIEYVPVIPPDFRPAYKDQISGQYEFDAMNDIYMTIMRRTYQIRSSGKGPLFDHLNYGLQRAVIDHDNFIRKKLQKKQGIIRQQILGKRIDYSARAVISPDPKLKVNEIGIPFRIAIPLFEPFIINKILTSPRKEELGKEIKAFNGKDLSIESIRDMFKTLKHGDKVPDSLYNIFFEATEMAMKGRVVLAKRDPVLLPESYRGFYPVLTHVESIQLCDLQVGGFNADFDGDQMGVYHPLSNEAQEEVKTKLMRVETGHSSTSINFAISKEMWVGLYIITKERKPTNSPLEVTTEQLDKVKDPYISVKFRGHTTTAGRAIFNSCFPQDYTFMNELATKKIVNKAIQEVLKKYGSEIVKEVAWRLEQVAFKWATLMAPSFSLDDLELPAEVVALKTKLQASKTIEEAAKIVEQAAKLVKQHLKDTGFGDLNDSGSTKGWDQPMQILFAKGIISDPSGQKLSVIKGSLSDGFTNTNYFDAASGARKGMMDRVLNTADTGYMSRKLAYFLNTVELDQRLNDCKTTRTLDLKIDPELAKRLDGRWVLKNGLRQYTRDMYKDGDTIRLRSPIFCQSKKVCHTCYGDLLLRHRSPYVGVLAAQLIGETGTQLIMKTFHTGGAVTIIKKEMIQDIVNNDPMVTKEIVTKKLSQKDNDLITHASCNVLLDLTDDYDEGDNLIIDEDEGIVWVKSLISKIEFQDTFFHLILDYPCEFNIKDMEKIGKESLKLSYSVGETILTALLEAAELKSQIQYVERLIGGRELVGNADHLFRKLFRIYSKDRSFDAVHLEVLISQCLRWKEDIRYPARLGKTWDPIMINMKQVVFQEGFVQGLAFENINNAISLGLIGDVKAEPSVIEKLLLGTLVETKEKKR